MEKSEVRPFYAVSNAIREKDSVALIEGLKKQPSLLKENWLWESVIDNAKDMLPDLFAFRWSEQFKFTHTSNFAANKKHLAGTVSDRIYHKITYARPNIRSEFGQHITNLDHEKNISTLIDWLKKESMHSVLLDIHKECEPFNQNTLRLMASGIESLVSLRFFEEHFDYTLGVSKDLYSSANHIICNAVRVEQDDLIIECLNRGILLCDQTKNIYQNKMTQAGLIEKYERSISNYDRLVLQHRLNKRKVCNSTISPDPFCL